MSVNRLLLETGDRLLLETGDALLLEDSSPGGTGNPWWLYAQQRQIMNSYLRQATASQSRAIGPFIDDTDFKTPKTGLTIANTDIKLVVNGGASANKNSGGATARVNGVYGVTFDATDTATVGELDVSVVVASALPWTTTFVVLEETVYDALFAASAPGYLQPTVAARTLDVSAAGNAGIDWANVENPTTALNLSATNIDVDQVIASVSGAVGSVTGAVGSVTGNVGGNVTGSVGSVVGAVGSVTGNVGGNVVGSVGSVVGDIGGLAAGAITDVEAAVWDATLASHVTAGSAGDALDAILVDTGTTLPAQITSEIDDVQADIAALNNLSAAQVNAEVLDVLNVDTFGEPTGVPPATTTLQRKISQLYMINRNGVQVTASNKTFLDDGGAAEWKKPLSDDLTTYEEGEGTTP